MTDALDTLGDVELEEVKQMLMAAVCLVAIAERLEPAEVLRCLAETFDDDDWAELKEAILRRHWEAQMGSAADADPI